VFRLIRPGLIFTPDIPPDWARMMEARPRMMMDGWMKNGWMKQWVHNDDGWMDEEVQRSEIMRVDG
jgi:hypothetical protein